MLVTVRTEEAEPLCQTVGEVRAHVEHLTLGLRVSVVLSIYSSCRCSVIISTPAYSVDTHPCRRSGSQQWRSRLGSQHLKQRFNLKIYANIANQPVRPLILLCQHPNITSTYHGQFSIVS